MGGVFIEPGPEIYKEHISFSQVDKYLTCAKKLEFSFVEGYGPGSGATVQGGKLHEVIEANYINKIEGGDDLPLADLGEMFVQIANEKFDMAEEAAARKADGEEVSGWDLVVLREGEEREGIIEQGLTLLKAYMQEIAPFVQPMAVEEKIYVDLGDDFPFKLYCIIDVLEHDLTIRDTKFRSAKKSRPKQAELDKDLQFSLYALAVRNKYQKVEPRLFMDYVVKFKRGPEAGMLDTTRTNEMCLWALDIVENVGRGILAGVYPANPKSFLCSEKWCEFWSKCLGGVLDGSLQV